MDNIRENQKAAGFATGIYGEFARDRDLTADERNGGRPPLCVCHAEPEAGTMWG